MKPQKVKLLAEVQKATLILTSLMEDLGYVTGLRRGHPTSLTFGEATVGVLRGSVGLPSLRL